MTCPSHLLQAIILMAFQLAPTREKEDTPPPGPSGQTQVVIIGTQHFISDMPDGFTPAHLRALLDKVRPKVLAVEAPSNVPRPWDFAPLELSWVTRPWALEHRVEAVPVGWNDETYSQSRGTVRNCDEPEAYRASLAQTRSRSPTSPTKSKRVLDHQQIPISRG